MLGSITPLGERGRGQRWGVTFLTFAVASVISAGGLGALLGKAGAMAGGAAGLRSRLLALGAAVAVGAALDARVLGLGLPTVRRQVNEDWLRRYRGWVYGVGFGFQLGLGFTTIVSLSAVYLAFGAALLSESAFWGALIGVTFGFLRALPVAATHRVAATGDLGRVDAVLRRWDATSRRLAIAAEVALGAIALTLVLVA